MKVIVSSDGDWSVGIPGGYATADVGYEVEEGDREDVRQMFIEFYSALWGEPATVLFDDEEFSETRALVRMVPNAEIMGGEAVPLD